MELSPNLSSPLSEISSSGNEQPINSKSSSSKTSKKRKREQELKQKSNKPKQKSTKSKKKLKSNDSSNEETPNPSSELTTQYSEIEKQTFQEFLDKCNGNKNELKDFWYFYEEPLRKMLHSFGDITKPNIELLHGMEFLIYLFVKNLLNTIVSFLFEKILFFKTNF